MLDKELKLLSDRISEVSVDMSSIAGQSIDKDKVEFYRKRFQMFVDEGVPRAIDAYLQSMLKDPSINDATRIAVGLEALKF